MRPRKRRGWASWWGRPLAVLAVCWLALISAYLLLLVNAAEALRAFGQSTLSEAIIHLLPVDEVHASLAVQMAGSAGDPRLSIALFQDVLASWRPESFASVAGKTGLAGLFFGKSTSPVAVWASHAVVSVLFLAAGSVLLRIAVHLRTLSFRRFPWRRRGAVMLALLIIGFAVGVQADLLLNDRRAPEILWPMLATKVAGVSNDGDSGGLPFSLLFAMVMHGTVLLAGYALASIVLLPSRLMRRGSARWWFHHRPLKSAGNAASAGGSRQRWGALAFIAACLSASPLGAYADIRTLEFTPAAEAALADTTAPTAGAADAVMAIAVAPASVLPKQLRPTVVDILQVRGEYWFVVDGNRRMLRGVGYNYQTRWLKGTERENRLARDFAQIRSAGFNAILGWSEQEFDGEVLRIAAANGLGVVAPFHLDPKLDYGDAKVRSTLMSRITVWVQQLKDSPGLWMWGLGNEVVHGIGDPTKPRAAAFATFLMDAAELIHRLDPYHPVMYRDAEDAYLRPVSEALSKRAYGPWFVYGMNFFSYRIGSALEKGPSSKLNHPLIISEFGPAGVNPAVRGDAYVTQWSTIREHQAKVLGGFAYVWSQKGPEALDKLFGLTNPEGQPSDDSLALLSATFAKETVLGPPRP